jgi:hypothetical protein
MPIRLHCDHCGKKIEAPDNAGGKWGKCPACHNKVYVPEPVADDELKLAPIDETEEERRKRLMRESYELTKDILHEDAPAAAEPGPGSAAPEISEEELTNRVIHYLRLMADGDLDEAQKTADRIAPHRRQAIAVLDSLARSDAPDPELEDIPQQVLSGLIRNMRTRLS